MPGGSKEPILKTQAKVIAQVRTHTGTVADHGKFERAEMIGGPDSGELENLRRLERSRAEDDVPLCAKLSRLSLHRACDANGSCPLEQDPGNRGVSSNAQVRSTSDRRQERAGGADASAILDCRGEIADTFLVNLLSS